MLGMSAIRQSASGCAPSRRRLPFAGTSMWARGLPVSDVVDVGKLRLYVLHELSALDLDPKAAGFAAVISGHSHRPGAEVRNGVLYLNPGSAGRRRFALPLTVARLHVVGSRLSHEIVQLRV